MLNAPSNSRIDIDIDWRGIIGILAFFALVTVFGPVALLLAWGIQRWAASETWNARDRWASIGSFAWVGGLVALLLLIGSTFPIPILSSFLSSIWHHLPLPGTEQTALSAFAARWFLAVFLTPLLAIGLELMNPRTRWSPRRTLTDAERAQVEAAQAQAVQQMALRTQSSQSSQQVASSSSSSSREVDTSRSSALGGSLRTGTTTPTKKRRAKREVTPTPEQTQTELPVAQDTLWTIDSERTEEQHQQTQQEQPSAPQYDWNTGDGSLKDL